MTGLASFDANRGMLVNEGPSFVHVAFQTRFLVAERLFDHARPVSHAPGWRERAVGIMAVRALHEPFVHAMLGRHLELGANRVVAAVAEFTLLFRDRKSTRLNS